ncbi:MAG: DUF167 domain-containing protein [Planctomycetota bacterium]|nr:DUF167 domain-containing protein [Planctomycetota bacterium]
MTSTPEGTVIPVRAVPRAKASRILGEYDGALRVAVAAPPEGGRANGALLSVLAEALGVRQNSLEIKRGRASRDKAILIRGEDAVNVAMRLRTILGSAGQDPSKESGR